MNRIHIIFCYRSRKPLYRKIQKSFVLIYPEQTLIFYQADHIADNNWVNYFIGKVCCINVKEVQNFWEKQKEVYVSNLDQYKRVNNNSKTLLYFIPKVHEDRIHLIPLYFSS